ncbi:hypothetical protein HH308_07175 [Gordonia sp. TBRC 11910]|uniref:Uncharacterized protein n=1 Tax=Gordonia asplenii TaxID=2725283 RepID=A0A848KVU6_9ACTN|nr:hypothetical protein [Gordonia asplenii]NMO00995.1 hypothetical protein [Gordonia asplenii]
MATELGALGYVCAGEAVLRGTRLGTGAVASLQASTRASWIRQSGRHAQAAVFDGAAASSAFVLVDAYDSPAALGALADALTGLAADNLGVGRFATTRRLLDRVEREVLPAIAAHSEFVWGARLELRWRWVSTELALYSGDAAGAAASSAAAVELAATVPSPRHRIKTDLIAAAAAAVNDDGESARALAASCERRCAETDLLPLRWAALTMLAGLADAGSVEQETRSAQRAAVAAELRRRGMVL